MAAILAPQGQPHIFYPKHTTPTETHLIMLSQTLIGLLNIRDFNDPFFSSRVRQNVYTELQGNCTVGLGPFLQNYIKEARTSPSFHVDVNFNATAMVDEEGYSATVIMSQHISGLGGELRGMEKAGTILFSWQRVKRKWWCSNATMIYGTPEFLV